MAKYVDLRGRGKRFMTAAQAAKAPGAWVSVGQVEEGMGDEELYALAVGLDVPPTPIPSLTGRRSESPTDPGVSRDIADPARKLSERPEEFPGVYVPPDEASRDISGVTPSAREATPYALFNAAFFEEYGRPITQAEQESNEVLEELDIPNKLFRLLPLGRQQGFDAKRLSQLSNEDLNPVIERILNSDPRGLSNFSADRLAEFDLPTTEAFFEHMVRVDPGSDLTSDLLGVVNKKEDEAGIERTEWSGSQVGDASRWRDAPSVTPTDAPPVQRPSRLDIPRAGRLEDPDFQRMLRLFRGEVAPMSEDLEEQREPGRRIDAEPSPVGLTDYPFSRAGVGATPTAVPSTTAGAPAIAPSDTGLYEDEPGWSVAPTKRARQLDQFLRGQDPFADLQLEQRFEQTRRGQGMADPEGARSPGEEPGLTPGYRRFGTGMTGTGPGVVAPIGTQFGDPRRVPVRPGSERGLTASQIDILLAGGDPMGLSRAEPERAAAQLTAGVGTAGVGVTGMGGVQAIRDPNTNFIVAIVIPGKPTIMQDDEGNPVEVPGKPTVINLPTPVSRLEEALRQAQITGFIDGKPTFAREQAISSAERANLSTRANIALNAAQEARARGDQKEAIRQFDKAQDLRDAIQRGQLAVSERAQTEAELEGRLRRDLQERQFQFQAARDPASAFVKAQRASAIATPGGTPPLQKDDDPGETPAENIKWQEGALNVSKTFVKNPLVSKRVQDIFRGSEGEFRVPSQQATQNLLASERAQLASGLKYMGFDPADVAEQTRKLTATTTPAQAMTIRGRGRQRGGLF